MFCRSSYSRLAAKVCSMDRPTAIQQTNIGVIHTPTTFSTVNSSTSKSHTLCDTFLLGMLWVQSRRPTLVVVPLSRTRVSVPIQTRKLRVSAHSLSLPSSLSNGALISHIAPVADNEWQSRVPDSFYMVHYMIQRRINKVIKTQ